ncbi:MAG: glycosyltransferase [Solirubrobacteraceae bacterium]
MPRASVIVPARDAEDTLPRTLRALAGQELEGGYEVIVVDDGSTDRTAALARAAPGRVTVLKQSGLGAAAARNLGAASASGSVLAFCDADVFPAPGWLAAGARALARADLVQGRVLPDPLAVLGPFDRTIWITSEVGLWETANLFVTREIFDRAGGFQELIRRRAGRPTAEDVWFGYRARRLGARPAFCAGALAHHAVFACDWREYVAERRRLRYFPAIAAEMPELRRAFLYRRVFLSDRSASFDLCLGGGLLALALRSPLPLALAVPYLRRLRRHAHRATGGAVKRGAVALADLAADLVGLAAMLGGSLRHRAVVL